MFWSNTGKGVMLNAMDEAASGGASYGSLHTAYSTTGSNEVTGGSPAYARSALTWGAASGGVKSLTTTLPTWNVPSGTTVQWFGLWDAVTSGNFLGMMPLGAGSLLSAMVEVSTDLTNNDIFSKAHGLVAGNRVVFWGTLPTGLSREDATNGPYYVIATGLTTDSFRVANSAANYASNTAVDITGTAPYAFYVQRAIPQTTVTQDTISLASGSIDLSVVA
jgi:hypothetical protein